MQLEHTIRTMRSNIISGPGDWMPREGKTQRENSASHTVCLVPPPPPHQYLSLQQALVGCASCIPTSHVLCSSAVQPKRAGWRQREFSHCLPVNSQLSTNLTGIHVPVALEEAPADQFPYNATHT